MQDTVPSAVRIARKSARLIRENILVFAGVNGALLLLALCGWIPLAVAAMIHAASSGLISLNALRSFLADM